MPGLLTMTTPERTPLAGLAYAGVGFSFAAIVGVMALLGHLADGWLGTEPWLLVSLAMAGVTYATMDLIRTVDALGRRKKDADG
ncbi:MAG: AtpZ/AtpI family protein [Planctomycetota bacterium]|nr:AtpZ/AtpI family protein [Planctomycetota bacterium]